MAVVSVFIAWSLTVAFLGRFGFVVVVLLIVDLLAVHILFAIGLLLLLLGQPAAIGGALVVNLLGDSGLILIGLGRFARSHLAAAQSFRGALRAGLAFRSTYRCTRSCHLSQEKVSTGDSHG